MLSGVLFPTNLLFLFSGYLVFSAMLLIRAFPVSLRVFFRDISRLPLFSFRIPKWIFQAKLSPFLPFARPSILAYLQVLQQLSSTCPFLLSMLLPPHHIQPVFFRVAFLLFQSVFLNLLCCFLIVF